MKINFIKFALGLILAVGSAQATDTRTFRNGYYFQNVSEITGNLTRTTGPLANKITVITQDQRWTSDTVYVLNNLTFVEAPATLTIEQGTIIRGEPATTVGTSTLNPADAGCLIITRGARIVAQGTCESPIYFTSWGDPFVPGGIKTIPNTLNGVTKTDTQIATEAALYNTALATTSFTAHGVDGKWGGLIVLGKAPVGFGGPTGAAGNIQVAIDTRGAGYTENPIFTFSDGRDYKVAPLFDPVGVASTYIVNGGKFTGTKPTFEAIPADSSTTATKTVLGTVTVAINTGAAADPLTTADFAAGDDYWEITAVAVTTAGLQYNVPTKKDSDPFLTANGFSGAQVAFKYTHTAGYLTSGTTAPGAAVGGTTCTVLPSVKMRLSPTTLYGVVVAAPNAGGVLTDSTKPSLTISAGGATIQATATTSVAGAVSDPSAIPVKGGIGANFIEGFQAIDGAVYGLGESDAVARATYSGGIYGGTNPNDNSGCIRFCRFSFGGFIASPNN